VKADDAETLVVAGFEVQGPGVTGIGKSPSPSIHRSDRDPPWPES
jgi:hypothetical protein